jgi:SAM-dependent methyltransferase
MQWLEPAPLLPEAPPIEADLAEFSRSACTWCGGHDREEFPREPCGWRRCRRCGFWNSMVPEAQDTAAGDYVYTVYTGMLRRKMRTSHHRLRVIEAIASAKGDLLDIGCSYGTMVLAAAERGWRAHGVDISEAVIAEAKGQGLDMRVGALTSLPYDDATMDVVHARHVLEHDIQTYRALAERQRVAKPGALVMIEVPDAASLHHRRHYPTLAMIDHAWNPYHRVFFTPEILAGFCTRLGWRYVPEPYWLSGSGHFMAWRWWKRLRETRRLVGHVVTFWRTPGKG